MESRRHLVPGGIEVGVWETSKGKSMFVNVDWCQSDLETPACSDDVKGGEV